MTTLKTHCLSTFFIGIFIAISSILFSGCLDVKIKTTTPTIEYYALKAESKELNACEHPLNLKLTIQDSSFTNTQSIFYRSANGKIQKLPNAEWIDLPSNLFLNAFDVLAQNSCVRILRTGNTPLKLNLKWQDFIIEPSVASVQFGYELFLNENLILQKAIVVKKDHNAKDANEQILALQNAINEAIEIIIKQVLNDTPNAQNQQTKQ